jgi:hypothetical protein
LASVLLGAFSVCRLVQYPYELSLAGTIIAQLAAIIPLLHYLPPEPVTFLPASGSDSAGLLALHRHLP